MNLIDIDPYGVPSSGGPDEIEALQTDVMRFFAILCLCLMVIFALVQSLPVVATPSSPQLVSPASLQQRIQDLRQRIDALQVQRQRLDAQIADRLNIRQIAAEQARNAQRKLADIQGQLTQAGRQAAALDQKIQEQRDALNTGHVQRRALNADIDHQQQRLNQIRQQLEIMDSQPAAASQQVVPEKKQPIADAAAEPSPDKGFALQFESPEVLTRLVRAGKIKLFARIGDSAWQLAATARECRAIPHQAPSVYYEMAAHTVPMVFVDALKNSVAAFGADTTQWAVVLPDDIRRKIEQIMTTHSAGRIVIGQLGAVRLEAANP